MKKYKESELVDLNKFVGTDTNIKSHTNCMTRFRFSIIDKSLVDTSKIKKLSFVRGTNWAGNELQVIIGPEVTNLRDQYMNLFSNNTAVGSSKKAETVLENHQFSFKKTITGFISNVIVPIIPALMAAGIMQAIYAILTSSNAIVAVKPSMFTKMETKDILSGVLFLISDTGLKFIGFFIGFNTIRYVGGKNVNLVMALLIPLIVSSPHLFPGISWTLVSFSKVGNFDIGIKIMGYSSMFLPQIGAGILYVYLDRWIKTWIPSVVDLVFRHALALLVVGMTTFFIIGPSLGLIESGVYFAFTYIQKVPYGIGNGIFGLCWTFLVLTGTHSAIIIAIQNELLNQDPVIGSQLIALHSITSMTTVATCLAVTIRAREATMKRIAFGSLFSAAFGVSEPTYYSISMIRPILFVPPVLARGLGGVFIGILDVRAFQPGGRGILGFTAAITNSDVVNPTANLLKMLGAMAFVFFVCFGLTMAVYQERKADKKVISKLYSNIFKTLKIKSDKQLLTTYKADLNGLKKQVSAKDYKDEMKKTEKVIVQENNLKFAILNQENKLDKVSDAYNKKFKKLENKINKLQVKQEKLTLQAKTNASKKGVGEVIKKLYQKEVQQKNLLNTTKTTFSEKANKINLKIEELNQKANAVWKDVEAALANIETGHLEIENHIKNTFEPLMNQAEVDQQDKIAKQIFNAVHNLEINYKIVEKMEV